MDPRLPASEEPAEVLHDACEVLPQPCQGPPLTQRNSLPRVRCCKLEAERDSHRCIQTRLSGLGQPFCVFLPHPPPAALFCFFITLELLRQRLFSVLYPAKSKFLNSLCYAKNIRTIAVVQKYLNNNCQNSIKHGFGGLGPRNIVETQTRSWDMR